MRLTSHLSDITLDTSAAPVDIVAVCHGQEVCWGQFFHDISILLKAVEKRSEKRWALFCKETYSFTTALIALSLSNKDIIIPGNITDHTLHTLEKFTDATIGDIPNATLCPQSLLTNSTSLCQSSKRYAFPALSLNQRITVFTSGSSGEPKAITKTLGQFEAEVQALEQSFAGGFVETKQPAMIAGTVSHQHIYGLIFRVFWPLATRRPIISEQILDTSLLLRTVIEQQRAIIWVASPAHLSRLNNSLSWPQARPFLQTIFSSGGPLTKGCAEQLHELLGHCPIEIFGSSETGGIAYRRQALDTSWQPLPGVRIRSDEQGALELLSAHIDSKNWYRCDDAVELLDNGQFILKGRLDRIIKLEEKRLSLVEMEQQLNSCTQIQRSHTLLLAPSDTTHETRSTTKRQRLACVCELSPEGHRQLQQIGKLALVNKLKQQLKAHFELSLIPKKWRFVDELPLNSQSKLDHQAINNLFEAS